MESEDDYTLKVREEGRNGEVTIGETGLTRVFKKRLGKDDRQFIPYSRITVVEHDRKRLGSDVVTVRVSGQTFEWKVAADAEGFVDRVNAKL